MASLHPTHGARVVLERGVVTSEGARYRVSVYEPREVHVADAQLDASGELRVGAWSSAPPSWASVFAERLLKSMAKKHAIDASWPRKLVRWREERE